MNRFDIERLLNQPEGQFPERKSCYEYIKGQWSHRKAKNIAWYVAENLAAFANADQRYPPTRCGRGDGIEGYTPDPKISSFGFA